MLAIRIKEERIRKGLTQKQVADVLGIPLKTYKNYEAIGAGRRMPDSDMIGRIAVALETTTDYLILGRE